MRVIAGKARRLQLKTVDGLATRPTTDRIKETLFNIIGPEVYGTKFLDLFSGSGAIGIEALSRGAQEAYFVENNKNAVRCIKENLSFTKLEQEAVVLPMAVSQALATLDKKNIVFRFVFMDPPYNHLYEKEVLEFLSGSDLINQETTIIVEASIETDFSYLSSLGFETIREKTYKTNKHLFIKKIGE